jgi:hypothetical protein
MSWRGNRRRQERLEERRSGECWQEDQEDRRIFFKIQNARHYPNFALAELNFAVG